MQEPFQRPTQDSLLQATYLLEFHPNHATEIQESQYFIFINLSIHFNCDPSVAVYSIRVYFRVGYIPSGRSGIALFLANQGGELGS